MGDVRCAQIARGKPHPVIPGYTKVNVSSMSNTTNTYRNLSPMLLGPISVVEPIQALEYYPGGVLPGYEPVVEEVTDEQELAEVLAKSNLYPEGLRLVHNDTVYFRRGDRVLKYSEIQAVCSTFERYWQGGKIYQKEVNDNGQVKRVFYEERATMYALPMEDKRKRRRKYPKTAGIPIASMYQDEVFDYVTSRKMVYGPFYRYLIENKPEFLSLKRRLANGENLLIVGPDGRDIPITDESLRQAIDDPTHVFGHELFISAWLKGIDVY